MASLRRPLYTNTRITTTAAAPTTATALLGYDARGRTKRAAESGSAGTKDMTESVHEDQSVALRLEWPSTSEVPLLFADNFLLSDRGDHYVLAVGQTDDPLVPGNDGAILERLRTRGSIDVRVLARFAVTPETLETFVAAAAKLCAESISSRERPNV